MRESAPSLKLWQGFTDTAGECNGFRECVRHLVSFPALTFPLFALPLQSLTLGSFSFIHFFPPSLKDRVLQLMKCRKIIVQMHLKSTRRSINTQTIKTRDHICSSCIRCSWFFGPHNSNEKKVNKCFMQIQLQGMQEQMWSNFVYNVVGQIF